MQLDHAAIIHGTGETNLSCHRHLCRSEIDTFINAAATPGDLLIACTQEAPVFQEAAALNDAQANLHFTNIRERAGWSAQGADAGPKMAALLAEAMVEAVPTAALPVRSDGRVLVWGETDVALAAARRLAGRLSVTCVVDGFSDATPPAVADMALFAGRPSVAQGHVGQFTLRFEEVSVPRPASRARLEPATLHQTMEVECDVVLDLSRRSPLFSGNPPRDGYVRVDPGDPIAVEKALFEVARHGRRVRETPATWWWTHPFAPTTETTSPVVPSAWTPARPAPSPPQATPWRWTPSPAADTGLAIACAQQALSSTKFPDSKTSSNACACCSAPLPKRAANGLFFFCMTPRGRTPWTFLPAMAGACRPMSSRSR